MVTAGRPWSFDGDGHLFRLVSEAHRIGLTYLFDPMLAVHTSQVEPLPHQITAMYEEMLPRQPLRFLLADDPGAGKTIMFGLLAKELRVRGDLQRCMAVCPGNLAEQWQDEMFGRFQLPFEIMTNDKLESARTGNWFQEDDLVVCRLEKRVREEQLLKRGAEAVLPPAKKNRLKARLQLVASPFRRPLGSAANSNRACWSMPPSTLSLRTWPRACSTMIAWQAERSSGMRGVSVMRLRIASLLEGAIPLMEGVAKIMKPGPFASRRIAKSPGLWTRRNRLHAARV